MAEVPYSQGVGQVAADPNAPNDYQNIHATAEDFGAGIAHGLEQVGAGLQKTSDFYAHAAVDDQISKDQERINKILRGNGSQVGFNTDGSPQYDLGYMGLHGRDALDARGGVESQIADIIKQSKANLGTDQQVHAYETNMRRYETLTRDRVGQHADTQANQWYQSVNKSASDLALNHISQNAYSEEEFRHAQADLQKTYLDQVTLQGGSSEQYKDAIMRARRDALQARIEAVSVHDPIGAARMVEENRDDLGVQYQPLSNQMKSKSDHMIGVQDGDARWSRSESNVPLTNPGNPVYTRISNMDGGGGLTANGLFIFGDIESRSGRNVGSPNASHRGFGQLGSYEFKRFGPPGGDINNPEHNLIAMNNYSKYNASLLRASLNISPNDASLYIAYQQGAGGAIELFKHPNALAVDVAGEKNILNNVPPRLRDEARSWTSSQFTNYWMKRFDNHGSPTMPMPSNSQNAENVTQGTIESAGIPTLGQGQVSGMPQTAAPMTSHAAPGSPQAINDNLEFRRQEAVRGVMEDYQNGNLTYEQQQSSLNRIHEIYSNSKVLEESNSKMKKAISDKAENDLYDKIWDPAKNSNLIQEIRQNKDIDDWSKKEKLIDLINKKASGGNDITLGDGYMNTLGKIYLGEIDSPSDLVKLQLDGKLSKSGVDSLLKDINIMQSDPTQKSLLGAKKKTLEELENKLVFNGMGKDELFASDEGRSYYRTEFLPRFNNAYSAYMQSEEGKKFPYKFFDQKNIESLMFDAPSQSKTNVSALNASLNPATAENLGKAGGEPIPPKPEGATDYGWKQIIKMGRPKINGTFPNNETWASAVRVLLANPTPERMQRFNKAIGSTEGNKAKEIVDKSKINNEDEENDISFVYGE